MTLRSALFPVGATVGAYPATSQTDGAPGSPAIATAAVDAAGLLTITNAGILAGTTYVCAASVNGVWNYARCRSTLDTFDAGGATGTVTLNSTTTLASVVATTGAYAVGQIITGAGIPAGTRLVSGSGGNWIMSAAATASGAGVAVVAYGARVPIAVLGATVVPQTQGTNWQARARQRRVTAGTS